MSNHFLDKLVGYYDDGYYNVTKIGLKPNKKSLSSKVLIIGRSHYIERVVTLPIVIKRDIKSAIDFEIDSLRDDYHVFYKITHIDDSSSTVMIWQLPKSINTYGALFVIPESYLLSTLNNVNQIITFSNINQSKKIAVATLNKSVESITDRINGQDIEHFILTKGVTSADVKSIEAKELPHYFIYAIKKSWKSLFPSFWLNSKVNKVNVIEELKAVSFPVACFLFLYIIISSAYISYSYDDILAKANTQSEKVEEVLTIQANIREMSEDYEKLNSYQSNPHQTWQIWRVLAPLYKDGVVFKFIRYNGTKFFVSASADSASNVLEYLYDIPYVHEPKFTAVVRKSAGKEQFIVSFSLKEFSGEYDER